MTSKRRTDAELTFRGICLGAVITVVFMSANVYLGLKTGITFSSSIPAAVISMSLLKLLGGGGILENNIVQTQASAAGTLCNVNLVIPGLVLIHYWNGFPLWQTMAVCLLGGLLGVAFSVPLRRVMVVDSDLPFPEGVAAAEVLTSGHGNDDDRGQADKGLRDLTVSALVAGGLSLLNTGTRLLADKVGGVAVIGHSIFRFDAGLSLALIGIGYLVRLGCCLALLIGIFIAWGVAVPALTNVVPGSDPSAAAQAVWAGKVRLIGAGLIAIAGLWTVATLVWPIVETIRKSARGRAHADKPDRSSRDIPIAWVGIGLAALAVPVSVLFWAFVAASATKVSPLPLIVGSTLATVIFGALMATACGYLAGLLGSSSSPISGIGILTVMLVVGCGLAVLPRGTAADAQLLGGLSLFVTSIIITASSIANDNLQDLKAGALVGATPWKQQAALAIGVVCGAVTIAPVLQLLYNAYGLAGALPREGMDPSRAMPAPQAALLTQVVDGIVNHRLDWTMVGIGAGLGAFFVLVEALLRRRGFTLPALSVGIGIYLPCAIVFTIAVGGLVGWFAERSAASDPNAQTALRRRGVLLSSGFLVGESLIGILIALTDILQGKSGALAIYAGDGSSTRTILSLALFAALLAAFYRLTSRSNA